MEVDFSRLPTGTSGWLALVDHAAELGDLSEVDWFELKGPLSFGLKASRTRSAVTVSRAILGMANRMPDTAGKHLGGHGVILVGVENHTIVGTEAVDGAVIGEVIEPYVGADGPRWDYQFIAHPDGLVLAVIVNPPQWGDLIFPCRKAFQDSESKLNVRDGDIFVRVPGRTRPARSHDLAQLDLRRSRAPHSGAQVDVTYDATFDRVDTTSVRAIAEDAIDRRASALLSSLTPPPSSRAPFGMGYLPIGHDQRSESEFRADVEQWRESSKAALDNVIGDFYRFELARGHLQIRNESLRYLEGVRVRVQFPVDVVVLMESDSEYCDHGGPFRFLEALEEPPPRYGDLRSFLPSIRQGLHVGRVASPVSIDPSPEGLVVSWMLGDLPSNGSDDSGEVFAVVTDGHHDEIVAVWTVTARGIDHVFQGELHLRCEQPLPSHLTWTPGPASAGDAE